MLGKVLKALCVLLMVLLATQCQETALIMLMILGFMLAPSNNIFRGIGYLTMLSIPSIAVLTPGSERFALGAVGSYAGLSVCSVLAGVYLFRTRQIPRDKLMGWYLDVEWAMSAVAVTGLCASTWLRYGWEAPIPILISLGVYVSALTAEPILIWWMRDVYTQEAAVEEAREAARRMDALRI